MSILRLCVLIVAFALAAGGAWFCLLGVWPPGLYLLGFGGLLVLGTVFERHYHKQPPPGARWEATGERFIDPQSGADVEVLYDPESGERRYESRP